MKTIAVRSLTLLLALLATDVRLQAREGTNGAPDPTTDTLEFSVLGMSCGTCADSATEALATVPGVLEPIVDFDNKSARVRSDGTVTKEQIRNALATLGFEARFEGETLDSDPLPEELRARLDIKTVSHGEKIRIKDHLTPGKITIFDYYADWCGPCHLLTPKLERLVLKYEDVALRKVDLIDYESKAALQATNQFRMPGLPFTRVFNDRGKLLGQIHGNRAEEIEALLQPHARLRQQALNEGK